MCSIFLDFIVYISQSQKSEILSIKDRCKFTIQYRVTLMTWKDIKAYIFFIIQWIEFKFENVKKWYNSKLIIVIFYVIQY